MCVTVLQRPAAFYRLRSTAFYSRLQRLLKQQTNTHPSSSRSSKVVFLTRYAGGGGGKRVPPLATLLQCAYFFTFAAAIPLGLVGQPTADCDLEAEGGPLAKVREERRRGTTRCVCCALCAVRCVLCAVCCMLCAAWYCMLIPMLLSFFRWARCRRCPCGSYLSGPTFAAS